MNYPGFDRRHADPANWKLGIFYFCPDDPRIIVPKRIRGLGWTINFARPMALPLLVAVTLLVFGVLDAVRALHLGENAEFAVKLLAALSVIALCIRLSKPGPRNLPPESGLDGSED